MLKLWVCARVAGQQQMAAAKYGESLLDKSRFLISLGLVSCVLIQVSQAQTWDDSSGNHRWSKSQNWVGRQVPDNDGSADISFAPSSFPDSIVDVAWDIRSLSFSSLSTAYSVSGMQLTIESGGITNNSAVIQSIINPILLGAAQTWNSGAGGLAFGGNVANAGFDLAISGSANTALAGVVSGSGGIMKNGSGTLTLSGANTFSGAVTINGGTLIAAGNGSLGSVSAITLNNGGTLSLGGADPINRVNDAATLTVNGGTLLANDRNETFGMLNLQGDSTITLRSGGTSSVLTFAGGTTTGGILTINGWTGTGGASGTGERLFLQSDPGFQVLQSMAFAGFDPGAMWLSSGEIVPVPEPASLLLLFVGTPGLAMTTMWRRVTHGR